ncbi:hypothetical protein FQV27_07195 [Paracoccus aurantiacus]|uniref:Uncharacterized protein n=1 Tax=Paracoccus aurantiacus TaxID=2599412 RepID=A0A5C6S6E0_9RHOB|nr:hypothetical protein [Paracoccus aurantiacus]TXB69887.1 hypothetical protein FQV27_07195 [Paracoccus aurantiacus]
MGLIRPELARWLAPRREFIASALGIALSGWIASRGGWFFALIGFACFAICAVWMLGSWRRLAFLHDIAAPGVVEVDEGAIRYYAARALGGTVALRDLAEIRLLRLNGRDHWRLRTRAGEALLIPVEAKGAEQLADAFTALPGLDLGRVSAALAQKGGPSLRVVWQAPATLPKSG